jgi:hypothetical protein
MLFFIINASVFFTRKKAEIPARLPMIKPPNTSRG